MKKNILITGASAGVGLSLAKHCAGEYHVLALARRRKLMEHHFRKNANVSIVEADLSDLSRLSTLADDLQKKFGPISYLINNAVVLHRSPVKNMNLEDLETSFRVNFLAAFVLMKKLLPAMRKRNFGRIVNLSSGGVFNNVTGCFAYSASKAALNSMTITCAKENADRNIKINLLSPGPCRTEMSPLGALPPEVCHPTADFLLSLDAGGPTGKFFWLGYELPVGPDLRGVDWEKGKAQKGLRKVL